jgi:Protein of unknown function (DUF2637)
VTAADRVIRWTTAVAVIGVAAVAAIASYEHAHDLVRAHGEAGWTARLVPLTVDGLIYASSMVMLDCARRKVPVPALAWRLLGLGITATLGANVAHGLGHGLTGAAVAAWPAVALVGSDELLTLIIRAARLPEAATALGGARECLPDTGPLQVQAAHACSRESLRPGACRRCARSAPGCMWGSHGPSGYALTWPRSTARRRARPSDIGLRSLRFSRLPDATGDRQRKISAVRRGIPQPSRVRLGCA